MISFMISFLIEWYGNLYLILALVQFILTVRVYFLTIDPHTESERDDTNSTTVNL